MIRRQIKFVVCSRPLLEWIFLRDLADQSRFQFVAEKEVVGLIGNGARVSGARLRNGTATEDLAADLVVDALGIESPTLAYFEASGFPLPKETAIDTHSGYVTRHFRLDDGYRPNWKFLQIRKLPPRVTRGIYVGVVENGHALISLVGGMKNYPPTDENGYHEAIAQMRCPLVSDLLLHSTACSSLFSYRSLATRWRHWDSIAMPPGLISLGDAFMRVTADYGAGITIASTCALKLQETLRRGELDSDRFQKSLAHSLRPYWDFVARQERVWLREPDRKSSVSWARTAKRNYLRLFWSLAIAKQRGEVYQSALEVLHLLKPQERQFHPLTWLRMMRGILGLVWDRYHPRSRESVSARWEGAIK